jgi:hypothetical protein
MFQMDKIKNNENKIYVRNINQIESDLRNNSGKNDEAISTLLFLSFNILCVHLRNGSLFFFLYDLSNLEYPLFLLEKSTIICSSLTFCNASANLFKKLLCTVQKSDCDIQIFDYKNFDKEITVKISQNPTLCSSYMTIDLQPSPVFFSPLTSKPLKGMEKVYGFFLINIIR